MQDLPGHEQNLVTIGKASKLFGVSIGTIRRWDKAGKIQVTRTPGGTRLIPTSEIERIKKNIPIQPTQIVQPVDQPAVPPKPIQIVAPTAPPTTQLHPADISNYKLHQKVIHHIKNTRPEWYRRYHERDWTNTLHTVIMVLFAVAVGSLFLYSEIIRPGLEQTQKELSKELGDVLAAAEPPRILSFQGRLTDDNNVPVVDPTNITFRIWSEESGGDEGTCTGQVGEECLWKSQDPRSVDPDQNGIFSVILGSGSDPAIPASLFSDNAALYLGVKVSGDNEMIPRQRIASVSYALNSDSLDGVDSLSFLRSDTSDAFTSGTLTTNDGTTLTANSSTINLGNATGDAIAIGGTSTFNTDVNLAFGGTENLALTSDGAGGSSDSFTLAVTPSASAGTLRGLVLSQEASADTNPLDAALVINNADNDVTVGDAISITNTGGGGTPYTNLFNSPTLDISGAGAITGATGITSSGTITFSSYGTDANAVLYTHPTGGVVTRVVETETGSQCLLSGAGASGIPVWGACGAGSVTLDAIQAAAGPATRGHDANTVTWQWDFTAADTGLTIGEASASTGGSGDQFLLDISTFGSASTASPLRVTNNSADSADIVFNLAQAGDMVIQDAGTPFVTFSDDGLTTFVDDIDLTFAGSENLVIGNTTAAAGDVASLSFTTTNATDGLDVAATSSADSASDTINGLSISWTESADADIFNAINIANTTSTNSTTTALAIGSGWDYGVVIPLTSTYALQFSDIGGTSAGGVTFGTDTNLFRESANKLATDDGLILFDSNNQGGSGGGWWEFGQDRLNHTAQDEANPRITIQRDLLGAGTPGIGFGAGGATAFDTVLYKSSTVPNQLRTNDQFALVGADSTGCSALGSGGTEACIWFGATEGTAANIFRGGDNILKTDDDFVIGGTTGLTFSGTGGDITFTNGEKIDNDTNDTIILSSNATAGAGVLRLPVKTSTGDPSLDVEGNIYYNATDNLFRCYQDSSWTNCIGSGGSFSGEVDETTNDALTFTSNDASPPSAVDSIYRDNGGDLNINVIDGKTLNIQENDLDEYNFSDSALELNSNNITGLGTSLTAAATLSINTTSNGNLTLAPNGSGDVISTLGDASQFAVNATPTADTAQDSIKMTLNPTITGSTATLQGLLISQSDNADTGVYDSLLKLENLKTPEITANALFIENNAASGTLSNAINITNTAGTLTTGISMTGTFTNYIDTPNFDVSNSGNVTAAGALDVASTIQLGSQNQTLDTPAAGVISISGDLRVVGNDIQDSSGNNIINLSAGTTGTARIDNRLGINKNLPGTEARLWVAMSSPHVDGESAFIVEIPSSSPSGTINNLKGFTFAGTTSMSGDIVNAYIAELSGQFGQADAATRIINEFAYLHVVPNFISTRVPQVNSGQSILVDSLSNADSPAAHIATWRGVRIKNLGGAGAVSTAIALDIEAQSGATTNTAINIADQYNASGAHYGICFDCDGTYSNAQAANGINWGTDNPAQIFRSANNTLSFGTTTTVTAAGALTISSGGSSALTLDSLSGNVTLATGDALLTSIAGNPSSGTAGQLWYDTSANKYKINENGSVKILCNTTDLGCGAGGSAALDTLLAATTDDTALLNADYTIEWNWALTSATSKGITIGESAASTNGVGDQHILRLDTAAGSTAGPLEIVSNSADGGDIEFNLNSAGDFEIQDAGTAFATFTDTGTFVFNSTNTTLPYDVNLDSVTTGDAFEISTTALTTGTALQIVGPSATDLFSVARTDQGYLDFARVAIGGATQRDQLYLYGRRNSSWQEIYQDFVGGSINVTADANYGGLVFDEDVECAWISISETGYSALRVRAGATWTAGDGCNTSSGGIVGIRKNENPVFETALRLSAATTHFVKAGFTNDALGANSAADPTDGVYFRKTDAGTNWFCVTRSASTETSTDTSVAVSTGSMQTLRIEVENLADDQARFFINGSQVCGGPITTNIPTVNMGWTISNESSAATRDVFLDSVKVWHDEAPITENELAGNGESPGPVAFDPVNNSDLAEYYRIDTPAPPGTVVRLKPPGEMGSVAMVEPVDKEYDDTGIGVVSSVPKITLGDYSDEPTVEVGLVGRLPVRVTTYGGADPIKAGDYLTTSEALGVAMKAKEPGPAIGMALEDYSGEAEGTILMFINRTWYQPKAGLATESATATALTLDADNNLTATISAGAKFVWTNSVGKVVAWVSDAGEAFFEKVTALVGDFRKIIFGELVAGKESQVAGQASFKPDEIEVFIESDKVSEDSLIYVTPTTKTDGLTLYIKEQKTAEGFTVALERSLGDLPNQATASAKQAIKFNWLIVNQE